MPVARVTCPGCKASFQLDAAKITPTAHGKCPKCSVRFPLSSAVETGQDGPSDEATARAAVSRSSPKPAVRAEGASRQAISPEQKPAPAEQMASGSPAVQDSATLAALAAWRGKIEPVHTSIGYRLAVLAVMLVVVALPVLYVALIAAVGWGVYWHAVNDVFWLQYGRGRGKVLMLVGYLAPIVAGAILVLFMFKPLFSRPVRQGRNRALSRDGEPALFSFVDRLCAAVGAPRPSAIEVDCQVNASAGLRRGMLSLVGNDLVLVIGLPLAAGLTLREMAGVLAHEFGHFAQASGMRVSYVVRSINMWFQRVVYERDEWDERLRRWSSEIDIRLGFPLLLARACVWGTRKILWCFMFAAHAVSCHLLRQMEFDADRHETRLSGSDVFESTSRKLTILNLAHQGAMSDLGQSFDEGRLADDLPALIAANVEQIPPTVVEAFVKQSEASKTGWFDTHPADSERVASAKREAAVGVFRIEAPASILFADFGKLCQSVTSGFYRDVLGPEAKVAIVPVAEIVSRTKARQEASKAIDRYFFDACGVTRPLVLPYAPQFAEPISAEECASGIVQARERARELAPAYQSAFERFNHYDSRLTKAVLAASVCRAELKIPKDAFDFPAHSIGAIGDVRREAQGHQGRFARDMEDFERAVAERMALSLRFLYNPSAFELWEDAESRRAECTRLVEALAALIAQLETIRSFRGNKGAFDAMCQCLSEETPTPVIEELKDLMKKLHREMGVLRQALGEVDYPFDHAAGEIKLGKFCLESLPEPDDLGGIYNASEGMLDRLVACYYRIIGRMVVLALDVESALGVSDVDAAAEPSAA